jgi:5'-3' exonuclease
LNSIPKEELEKLVNPQADVEEEELKEQKHLEKSKEELENSLKQLLGLSKAEPGKEKLEEKQSPASPSPLPAQVKDEGEKLAPEVSLKARHKIWKHSQYANKLAKPVEEISQLEFTKSICNNYLEGLIWVFNYYFHGHLR